MDGLNYLQGFQGTGMPQQQVGVGQMQQNPVAPRMPGGPSIPILTPGQQPAGQQQPGNQFWQELLKVIMEQ